MELDIHFEDLKPEEIYEIESKMAESMARDAKIWWSDKSKEGFYLRMARTVTSEGNDVVTEGTDAGLAAWIWEKRKLGDEYVSHLNLEDLEF